MTKQELIDYVQQRAGDEDIVLSKTATGDLLDIIFDVAALSIVREGKFSYPKFGTLKKTSRAARAGKNPQTGDPIQIPASKSVSFKPASALKDSVNA